MASAYSLEAWEVSLIKGLLAHSSLTQQQIVAYFTRPSRTIHANVISEIKLGQLFNGLPAATRTECDNFIYLWEAGSTDLFRRSGISPSPVPPIYSFGYSFYPVGQGALLGRVVKA